jgi:penicillin-binding protein 2
MAQSCNVYFYHLAEKVGLERMAQVASSFGFGEKLDLGLGETSGFVPNLDYYRKNGGFRGGYALNTAIGQGAVRTSVLQLALAYAALGNGGKLYRPMLVERIERPSGEVVEQYKPRLRGLLPASAESLERLRRGLVDVLADSKGTANSAYVSGLDIAGKSGTAQVRKNRRGEATGWDTGNDHAWFVGFSPSRRSHIAVAVLIEHGGLGGHVAAPTALEIIRGYYDQVAPEQRPQLYLSGSEAAPLHTALPTASAAQ